ncbi:TPA: hypothetical protein ACH3X1_012660 [Trebouxia sp. C0004]
MLLRACLLFTVISLVAAYSVQPTSEITCNECLLIAKTLEAKLLKLEQVQDSSVGKITHRRRMSHPRSEPQIFNALDTICTTIPAGGLQQGCIKLISEHREALENDIYAEGIEHVRRLLCSDFSKTCPMHALYDTGEL